MSHKKCPDLRQIALLILDILEVRESKSDHYYFKGVMAILVQFSWNHVFFCYKNMIFIDKPHQVINGSRDVKGVVIIFVNFPLIKPTTLQIFVRTHISEMCVRNSDTFKASIGLY